MILRNSPRSCPHDPLELNVTMPLQSLKGWRRGVGCMGGEPTMHPQFVEICGLYKKYFPRSQRGLFTAGAKFYEKHKELALVHLKNKSLK